MQSSAHQTSGKSNVAQCRTSDVMVSRVKSDTVTAPSVCVVNRQNWLCWHVNLLFLSAIGTIAALQLLTPC